MAPERPGPDDNGVVVARGGTLPTFLPKEEQLGTTSLRSSNGEDDDLTSLTWLVQDKNLLKGINLKSSNQQTSPTSDFAEDGSIGSDRSDSSRGSVGSAGTPTGTPTGIPATYLNGKSKQSQLTHYDPMVHVKAKPPYSFSCLIFMAIEDSAARALPVKEIYAWIQNHFPFYRDAPAGWKNSVRHNLSLNKCFSKVEKAPNLGKGSLWMVDPAFRPNLLQSMSKAPLTSFNFSVSPDLKSKGVGSSPKSIDLCPSAPAPTPKRLNSDRERERDRSSRLPNPELFPFLSQRLAASGVGLAAAVPGLEKGSADSYVESDDELEDVDAAAAILTLKHGPRVIIPPPEDVYKRKKAPQANSIVNDNRFGRKSGRGSGRVKKRVQVPVITSSPSEDHTYSAGPSASASSPDEAYGEGSDTDGYDSRSDIYDDSEEQRRIAEGAADALLNLAGVASRVKRELDETVNVSSPTQPSVFKRIRRQRRLSGGGTSRLGVSARHRSRVHATDSASDSVNRPSVTQADIMADLEVIRNNNNNNEIVKSESVKEKSSWTSRIKVKYPSAVASFGDGNSQRSSVIKRVSNGGQGAATGRKRKHWLSARPPKIWKKSGSAAGE